MKTDYLLSEGLDFNPDECDFEILLEDASCPSCCGEGEIYNSEVECEECEGSGEIEEDCCECGQTREVQCSECEGSGRVEKDVECDDCEGTGSSYCRYARKIVKSKIYKISLEDLENHGYDEDCNNSKNDILDLIGYSGSIIKINDEIYLFDSSKIRLIQSFYNLKLLPPKSLFLELETSEKFYFSRIHRMFIKHIESYKSINFGYNDFCSKFKALI